MANEKPKAVIEFLPAGTLINYALFERDAFKNPDTGAEGKPLYKAEIAIPAKYRKTLVEMAANAAYKWYGEDGEDAVYNEEILLSSVLDGDEMAADREERGKAGDAYAGCVVVRSNTEFNKYGEEGPGGLKVIDEDLEELEKEDDGKLIYSGCKVILKVAISFFPLTDKRDKKDYPFGYGCKFYLVAVQKVDDGERLFSGGDPADGFEKVGQASRKTRRDLEDEEERPRKRRRREEPEDDDDGDEEERPRKRRRREEPEDEEEDRPRKRRQNDDDDEEDDDPKPRRRRR